MSSNKLIIVAALAALMAGCGKETHSKENAPQAATIGVSTETLTESNLEAVYQASGTVEARVTTPVSARVMGYVREIRVQAGDHVRADQVVAVIDSRDLETAGSFCPAHEVLCDAQTRLYTRLFRS